MQKYSMNQVYLNIAVGFIFLLLGGFEWHRNRLNICIFIVALIHLAIGVLMASIEHHPSKGFRHYIFTQRE